MVEKGNARKVQITFEVPEGISDKLLDQDLQYVKWAVEFSRMGDVRRCVVPDSVISQVFEPEVA